MNPFNSQFSASLERNGRTRSIDVCARRYADGAFVGCVRVPSERGSTSHTVEISPREASAVRELVSDTAASLRSALVAARTGGPSRSSVGFYDVVGHTYDIVGAIAPRSARAIVNGVPQCYDIVGSLADNLRGIANAGGAGTFNPLAGAGGTATGALRGLATGGVQGAGMALANAAGQAFGLDAQGAQDTAIALAGAGLDAQQWQARRDRALRELAQVIAAGTHPLGSANWLGAVRFHVNNQGITPTEGEELFANQGAIQSLNPLTPFPFNRATGQFEGPGSAAPARRPPPNLSGIRAQMTDLSRGAGVEAVRSSPVMEAALPGVAGAQLAAPPSTAGAALGASELLARALSSLALERGASSRELADASAVASAALRSVDAIAGARVGDPRARAALRAAINQGADRTARALRIGAALVGQ